MVWSVYITHTLLSEKKKRTNKRSKTTSGFFWLGHLEETFSAAAGMEFRLFFIFQRHSSIGGCIDKKSIKTARFQADNHVIWCCVVRSYTIFLKAVIFFGKPSYTHPALYGFIMPLAVNGIFGICSHCKRFGLETFKKEDDTIASLNQNDFTKETWGAQFAVVILWKNVLVVFYKRRKNPLSSSETSICCSRRENSQSIPQHDYRVWEGQFFGGVSGCFRSSVRK